MQHSQSTQNTGGAGLLHPNEDDTNRPSLLSDDAIRIDCSDTTSNSQELRRQDRVLQEDTMIPNMESDDDDDQEELPLPPSAPEEGGESAIRYTEDGLREGLIMALLPLSRRDVETQQRQVIEFRVYVEISAFLAYKHIQKRSGAVLHDLPRLLETCDFTWTYQHFDTEFSPLQAAKHLFTQQPRTTVTGITTSSSTTTTTTLATNATTTESVVIVSDDDTFDGEIPVYEAQDFGNITWPDDDNQDENSNSLQQLQPLEILNGTTFHNLLPPHSNHSDTDASENDDTPEHDDISPPSNNTRRRHKRLQQRELNHQEEIQEPFAIMGAARSVVSQTVGILGNALNLPQISSSSTAATLDDLELFARTVPTNGGDAHAIMAYLHHLQVTHVGVLFIKNVWGRRYEVELQTFAKQYNITMYSASYTDEDNIHLAIQQLEQSKLRYFFGVINPSAWKPVIRQAYETGIMGKPEYQWFLGDLVELVGDSFELDRETEGDIAQALHGTGVVFLQVDPHAAFDRAIAAFADNIDMQREFIQCHAEPHLFENFTFTHTPGWSLFQYLTYDAIVALGLTACDTPGLFTGKEFYDQLLQVDFEGVSGRVQLHHETGTRRGEGLQYQIFNLVLSDYENAAAGKQSTLKSKVTFSRRAYVTVDLSPALEGQNGTTFLPLFQVNKPFIYHDNTTTPPMTLPPLNEDMNLIPKGVLGFGLSLAAMIMLLSIGCAYWTYAYRTEYVVKAAQPVFLMLICLGTFIVACTVIPLSFQEDMPGLDSACMALPWLFCIGFTIAIAALFSKAHRINKVMQCGTSFRRVKVEPSDVMKPFAILLSINVILLTAWTASPWSLSWHREAINNVDLFGRTVESYGVCRADDKLSLVFWVPLVMANVTVLVIATYESYRGRKLPNEFSESRYLALALLSLCETSLLGTTTLFAVVDQPTSFFLVLSLVLTAGCLSILVPVFLPKYMQRHKEDESARPSSLSEFTGMGKYSFATKASRGLDSHPSSQLMSENNSSGRRRPSLISTDSGHGGSGFLTSMSRIITKESSAFLASEPQPVRRVTAQASKRDTMGGSSGYVVGGGSGYVGGNKYHRGGNNIAHAAKVATAILHDDINASTQSLPQLKVNGDKKLLSTLSEHISFEESMFSQHSAHTAM